MRFKENSRAASQILLMPKLLPLIDKSTRGIADASGSGYYPHTNPGHTRHRGAVVAGSPEAARDNRRNNTLIRNMDAGRL